MLGFPKTSEAELVAVEDDEAVRAAATPLMEAQKRLEAIEAEERKLIHTVTAGANSATDEQLDEARARLSIVRGTQNRWFLESAQSARNNVKALRTTHQAAVQAARARLEAAGLEWLKSIMSELRPHAEAAQKLALKAEELRQTVGDAGGDIGGHPVPCLLPGQILDFQMGIAKDQGLL